MTTEANLEQVLLRLRALEQECDALRVENAALARKIEHLTPGRPEATTPAAEGKDVSRRHLLTRLAGVAAAGVVGQAVLSPKTAGATVGPLQYGWVNNSGTDETVLNSTTDEPTLRLVNFGTGHALNAGVAGNSSASAIVASTAGRGHSLYSGHSGSTGSAAYAEIGNGSVSTPSKNASPAIVGRNAGAGPAVEARITNGANTSPVIVANTNGGAGGILEAEITNAGNGGHVITALSAGGGNGVVGQTHGTGHGIVGDALGSGAGVAGTSRTGPGVQGSNLLAAPGVAGVNKGTGRAVQATIVGASNSSAALFASTNGTGRAVEGQVTNAASTSPAIFGQTAGNAPAIKAQSKGAQLLLVPGASAGAPTTGPHAKGEISSDLNGALWLCVVAGTPGTWVRNITSAANALGAATVALTSSGETFKATSTGATAAVVGVAAAGRGGQFQGGVAQLRLVPAAGAHPATGLVGDLFLDSAKFLWLCKGSTTWVKLG